MDRIGRFFLDRPIWVTALVLLALVALPVAVWLDLYNLSEQNLRTQAASLNRVISIVRTYYATNVVARVLSAKGRTQPLHSYREVPGAIPIPATLSIELGEALSADLGDVAFRFVSDFPFVGRRPHDLDPFERRALQEFRKPGGAERFLVDSTGTVFDQRITLATPVVMSEACVACHNSHPGSPKWDWGVGDVRGIQTVSIHQPRPQPLVLQVAPRLSRRGRDHRPPLRRSTIPPRQLLPGLERRARGQQLIPHRHLWQDLQIPLAADLPLHLLR
ncbi:MAG: DUF3365 domain-containing protein, partial [Proteobacteria bacterium]|nr:DUF3365 domain-containing protein [Pseudomonadota bacterium]